MARARMGFVGYVRWIPAPGGQQSPNNAIVIRATSADVKLTQEISYPDVIDSKIDQTVYELGPQVVGGNIAFPLIHEIANAGTETSGFPCGNANSTSGSLAQTLWSFAAKRDIYGRMDPSSVFDCVVRYADNLGYTYKGCMVNTMTFTLSKSEPVNVSCEVIGGAGNPVKLREDLVAGTGGFSSGNSDALSLLAPARIVTWNDVGVGVWGGTDTTQQLVRAGEVTEFTCTINNNIERIYSLNGKLSPVDIVAKKREVSGNLKFLGGQYDLSQYTIANQTRFTSNAGIAFGYRLGADVASYYWATGLYGVIFEIEEVGLTNGLFESSTKWRALGDCDNNHLAIKLGDTLNGDLVRPTSSNYGSSSAPDYPTFDTYGTTNP